VESSHFSLPTTPLMVFHKISEGIKDQVEGYYRSQHLRDGGTTTERTTDRISWGKKEN
jgi:hypothetical protein